MRNRLTGALIAACCLALLPHASAQTPVPLNVITFPGGANLPLWVAQEKGLFAREKLAVKISPTPNSVTFVKALMAGEQDIALSAFDNIVAYQEGQGEVALDPAPDFFAFMAFSRGTVRLVATPDTASIADLRGKTLGVDAVATGYSLVLQKLLSQAGLKPGDYTLATIGGTGVRAQQLMENKFAATILTTPLEIAPEARGYKRLANVQDAIGPYQTIVGMARRSWADKNRGTVVAFARASADALDWLYKPENRAEAVAIYVKYLPNVPAAAAEKHVDALLGEREGLAPGGRMDPAGVATVLAIRSEFGRPQKTLNDPARYVDDSFLRAAKP